MLNNEKIVPYKSSKIKVYLLEDFPGGQEDWSWEIIGEDDYASNDGPSIFRSEKEALEDAKRYLDDWDYELGRKNKMGKKMISKQIRKMAEDMESTFTKTSPSEDKINNMIKNIGGLDDEEKRILNQIIDRNDYMDFKDFIAREGINSEKMDDELDNKKVLKDKAINYFINKFQNINNVNRFKSFKGY